MLIVSRVCAVFKDRTGKEIHRVTPALRGMTHEAPDAIQEDRLFQMLLKDGSITANLTKVELKAAESDPYVGFAPDGKSILAKKEAAEDTKAENAKTKDVKPTKAAKPAKTAKETESAPKAEAVLAAEEPTPDKAG